MGKSHFFTAFRNFLYSYNYNGVQLQNIFYLAKFHIYSRWILFFFCQALPLTFQSSQLQCHLPNVHWQSIVAAEEEVLLLAQLIL